MIEAGDPIVEELRDRVLLGTLPQVPFDGWTITALQAGARSAGLDALDADRAFPGGRIEAIEYHSAMADRRMAAALATMDLPALRVRDRIVTAIRLRFEQSAGEREAIRRALTVLALPQNVGVATRALYRTVDTIWFACGDRSTDFSYYTKRGLLAAVYGSAVLYWLSDTSEDFSDTSAFVQRRVDDVMLIPRLEADLGRAFGLLPDPFRLLPSRVFRGVSRARWH